MAVVSKYHKTDNRLENKNALNSGYDLPGSLAYGLEFLASGCFSPKIVTGQKIAAKIFLTH